MTNTTTQPTTATRYIKAPWFMRKLANPVVAATIRTGLSPRGGMLLALPGRVTGRIHEVPVNPLQLDDHLYLVAPRGTTDWVRNLRAAPDAAVVRRGRRRTSYRANEVADPAKPAILRAYLQRWAPETAAHFAPLTAESTDDEFAREAHLFPVFELTH